MSKRGKILDAHTNSHSMPKTQTVIAALNEEEGIGLTIMEIKKIVPNTHILVVDGNSNDHTVKVSKELGADVTFQEGKGKGDALAKAVKILDPEADYVILTDADYTYPAKEIPEMINILQKNPEVGMVCGNRFNHHLDKKQASHDVFYFGNQLIALAQNILNSIELRDPLTGLRVVRACLLRNWKVQSKGFDIEVELNHHIERQGFEISEIDIEYRQRLGEKKLKVRHGTEIMKRILIESAQDLINSSLLLTATRKI